MELDPHDPIYTISVVARLLNLHEQTLRQYERLGLVSPCRSLHKTRMYSQVDVTRLECISYLVRARGVNLAGVRMLVELSDCNPQLAEQILQRNFQEPEASNEKTPQPTHPESAHGDPPTRRTPKKHP